MVLSKLKDFLKSGDVSSSLDLMRNWLAGAEPGEPERLLTDARESLRPKIALLMRDLLSRYPSTIVGTPMLMYAAPDFETPAPWGPSFQLPFPTPDLGQPCSDLHFLGWLPTSTPLPVALPFRPEKYSREIPWMTPTAVVAVFRSHPGLFDLDSVELPNLWWGHLFSAIKGNIHLTARMLLPYPDALESARVMQAAARGEPPPSKGHFLTDTAWTMSCDEAALFNESCRHHRRNTIG